jgi:uncharacterized protein YqcC (DUF446 family)
VPDYQAVKSAIDAIAQEMRTIGWWSTEPLPPEAYAFKAAFAMDTMPFSFWLQFIFIPRVNEIIETHGTFPSSSQVGAQAIREFDGVPEAAHLVELLIAFDDLIERG